ncbi:MAG: helix-turn-helix domain-containing protein [Candidatus Doudnabacteria bacterium]
MEYKVYKRIPNVLRKYRRASGLNQLDVAKILGMKSSSRISRWEKGNGVPNTVNVFKLAVLYRVMADSLFIDLIRQLRSEIHINEKKYLKNKNKKL